MLSTLCLAAFLTSIDPAADFASRFTGRTLRFDYHHVGTAGEQHIAQAGLRLEGDWPGSRTQLVDPESLGAYRFRVLDAKSGELIFARAFSSIYGEWKTTGEAKRRWRALEESQRFPEPKAPVILALDERGDDGVLHEIWRDEIDPNSRFVDRAPLVERGEVLALAERGPAATKVDLLVVADGYTAAQRAELLADAQRLTGALFATEPFKRRANDFNVRVLHVPSTSSGISNPRKGEFKASELGLSFNAFDSDRYVLTFADRALRELVARVPYDALILLANERKYGGGGIYNLWATCSADTEPAEYVFVHEFGHSFAGLADEYYSSQVAYEDLTKPGVEPWEPNVTALLDPAKLKWRDLVTTGTPLPTPWDQKQYDDVDLAYQARRKQAIDAQATEETNERLMREIKELTKPLLAAEPHFGKIGAFEGAMYLAKGLYRPSVDCIMFTRNPTTFCKVCERALEHTIDRYVK
ncbi:MAG: IgA Peptidase M64 [Planctomycetes bacterium]|nr:IgA Peptidase M64 [Planctomycetota bacterium]